LMIGYSYVGREQGHMGECRKGFGTDGLQGKGWGRKGNSSGFLAGNLVRVVRDGVKMICDLTHIKNTNIIKEIRASINATIRNQGASIKTLEIQIGQMSKVLQERGIGGLPISTEQNLRDHVKSISTTKAGSSKIYYMGCSHTPYQGHNIEAYFLKQFPFQGDYKTTNVMIRGMHKM
nr:hypothetical protein CTI12_AA113060 [Tanacetum cinerariifolium]